MGAFTNALLGGWSVTSVGRFQVTAENLGNVNLVGMSLDDLQDVYKFYRKPNTATRHRRDLDAAGRHRPQHASRVQHEQHDASTGTRRAWARRRDGTSRRRTPRRCIQVKAGDCAPRNLQLLSPWFKRVDLGIAKRVEHRRHDEHRCAVRVAQPVRQPELHPGRQSRIGREHLPHHGGLPGSRATPTIPAAESGS